MKSIAMKIDQIDGLRGTKDLTPWEDEFVTSIVERVAKSRDTRVLSARQVEIVERIFERHFA